MLLAFVLVSSGGHKADVSWISETLNIGLICFIEVNVGFSSKIKPIFATPVSFLRLKCSKHCSPLLICPYSSKPAHLHPQHLIVLYSSSCEHFHYHASVTIIKDMGQSAPVMQYMDMWKWETKTKWRLSGESLALETLRKRSAKVSGGAKVGGRVQLG